MSKLKMNDKQLLDFLQLLTNESNYSGKLVLRESTTGRGWRLHQCSYNGTTSNVREAIEKYANELLNQQRKIE